MEINPKTAALGEDKRVSNQRPKPMFGTLPQAIAPIRQTTMPYAVLNDHLGQQVPRRPGSHLGLRNPQGANIASGL